MTISLNVFGCVTIMKVCQMNHLIDLFRLFVLALDKQFWGDVQNDTANVNHETEKHGKKHHENGLL